METDLSPRRVYIKDIESTTTINFGKYKGKKAGFIAALDPSYILWMNKLPNYNIVEALLKRAKESLHVKANRSKED